MSIDIAQFHQIFFEESFEGLDIMESGLLNLDLGAADSETVNTIFRAAHSIKGGSGTFGFKAIADFTHVMETLLDEMRDGRREVTREAVDQLLQSVDCLRGMLEAAQSGDEADTDRVAEVHAALEALMRGEDGAEAASEAEESCPQAAPTAITGWRINFRPHLGMMRTGNDPLRMLRELASLGRLEVQADLSDLPSSVDFDPEEIHLAWVLTLHGDIPRELVSEVFAWVEDECALDIEPLAAAAGESSPAGAGETETVEPPASAVAVAKAPERRVGDRRKGDRRTGASQDGGSIRVGTDKIDDLINKVGELVITQSMLGQFSGEFDPSLMERLTDGLAQLERNTRDLQESVMQIRMLPISFSFNRFPRLVHDLSAKLGKKVELVLSGEQTELDKTVLEKIGDPLVHLVRNSLDHGLELPEERLAAGKSEVGRVYLDAAHEGGNIVVRVRDDGRGLNRDKLLAKAIERGVVSADDELSDDQINNLIFAPGFSTADEVSDVSGRGVGMDVVRRNIKDLGGSVEIESEQGAGSTITIRLPLTLAILDGQLVRVGQQTYIIPLIAIIESLQVTAGSVNAVAGQSELYKFRDEYISIIRLYDAFDIAADATDLTRGLLVVVEGDGRKTGLFVDDLLSQQQVVIKSLDANFRPVPGLSGATILGDGSVAMIVDVGALVSNAGGGRPGGARSPDEPRQSQAA